MHVDEVDVPSLLAELDSLKKDNEAANTLIRVTSRELARERNKNHSLEIAIMKLTGGQHENSTNRRKQNKNTTTE